MEDNRKNVKFQAQSIKLSVLISPSDSDGLSPKPELDSKARENTLDI